ncbi:MAG TPA: hypothetical protein VM328_02105, partial [Fimbriimonadaceae bacterium]|nr:hypothetical protein [Fimbriimonadaceae bacterium]
SGACLDLLYSLLLSCDLQLSDTKGVAADLGPGSFTGVRVGVTLAKTLAFTLEVSCYGADAFNLIGPGIVAVPSKKGEFFVRLPGLEPERQRDVPPGARGYGVGFAAADYPHASAFGALLKQLHPVPPERLNPVYLIEPSISQPKSPYRMREA